MRTTLTLDDDVAAKLKAEVRKTGKSFKDVVNQILRIGLMARKPPESRRPFVVQARPLGLRRGLEYDRTNELIEHIEGPLAR